MRKIKYGRYFSIDPYDYETYYGEVRIFTGNLRSRADDNPPEGIDDEIEAILRPVFGNKLTMNNMESQHSIDGERTLEEWKSDSEKLRVAMVANGWKETKYW